MLSNYDWYIGQEQVPGHIVDILSTYYASGYLQEFGLGEGDNEYIGDCPITDIPSIDMNGENLLFRYKDGKVFLESKIELTMDMFYNLDTYAGTFLPWKLYDDESTFETMLDIEDDFKQILLAKIGNMHISDRAEIILMDESTLVVEAEKICYVEDNNGVRTCYPSAIFLYHEPTKDWEDVDLRYESIYKMIKEKAKVPSKSARK